MPGFRSLYAESFGHQPLQTRLINKVIGEFLVGKHGQGSAFGVGNDDLQHRRIKAVERGWRCVTTDSESGRGDDDRGREPRERDPDKRRQMYIDIQAKEQADGAIVCMFQETEPMARRANVAGFFDGPNTDLVYYRSATK